MHLNNNPLSALGSPRPDSLVHSLGKKAHAKHAAPPGASAPPTNSTPVAPATVKLSIAEAEPLSLEGLKRAWGTDDPRYDFNRDGSVNMRDMLNFLAQNSPDSSASAPSSISATPAPDPAAPASAAQFGATDENAADAPPPPLTIDGLMAAWGKADEHYDFNRDGIVNMPDLLELMTKLSAAAPAAPPSPPIGDGKTMEVIASIDEAPVIEEAPDAKGAIGPVDPAGDEGPVEPLTVDGLMAVWGKADERYDLNSDGVVNMHDLVSLLSRLRGEPPVESGPLGPGTLSADAPPSISAEGPSTEGDPPSAPLSLKGLLEVWGKGSDQYDFNEDGVVGMQDLLTFLSRSSGSSGDGALPPLNSAPSLASSIMGELKSIGFGDQPPANIHQLIGNLDIESSLQKQLIEHLSKEYPAGLGVNFVG